MDWRWPLDDLFGGEFLDSLLADFLIAFAFFTALAYAVLARRFGEQRPAIVMAAALGFALALGLVWWEVQTGWSLRNLGPIAAGFLIMVLAGVLYQAFRQVGGSWGGAAIALGLSLLIGLSLAVDWPFDLRLLRSVAVGGIIVGVVLLLMQRHGHRWPVAGYAGDRVDLSDFADLRRRGAAVSDTLGRARRFARLLDGKPDTALQMRQYLDQALPAEGWLTDRLASLRGRAELLRAGKLSELRELKSKVSKLSGRRRQQLTKQLKLRYQELALDVRIERLDQTVAETERRVRDVTQQARQALDAGDNVKVVQLIDTARHLQKHVDKLIRVIERTDQRVIRAAHEATAHVSGGNAHATQ